MQTLMNPGWITKREERHLLSPENRRLGVNHRKKDGFLSAHIDIEPRLACELAAHTRDPRGP